MTWIVVSAVAVGTYLMRASMFVVVGRRSLPAWATGPMSLVAPAAIAALVTSVVFTSAGSLVVPPAAEIAAVLAAVVAVRRTGNVMHAFTAGLPVFWLVSLVAA